MEVAMKILPPIDPIEAYAIGLNYKKHAAVLFHKIFDIFFHIVEINHQGNEFLFFHVTVPSLYIFYRTADSKLLYGLLQFQIGIQVINRIDLT